MSVNLVDDNHARKNYEVIALPFVRTTKREKDDFEHGTTLNLNELTKCNEDFSLTCADNSLS